MDWNQKKIMVDEHQQQLPTQNGRPSSLIAFLHNTHWFCSANPPIISSFFLRFPLPFIYPSLSHSPIFSSFRSICSLSTPSPPSPFPPSPPPPFPFPFVHHFPLFNTNHMKTIHPFPMATLTSQNANFPSPFPKAHLSPPTLLSSVSKPFNLTSSQR